MKRISINYPIEIEVVDKASHYNGRYDLQPTSANLPYNVTVLVPGSNLSTTAPSEVTFYGRYDNSIAGKHRIRNSLNPYELGSWSLKYVRRADGTFEDETKEVCDILPRDFSEPFELNYKFGANGDRVGQSSKSIVDFRHLYVDGNDDFRGVGASLRNPRFHSYKGDLLMLGEMASPHDSDKRFAVLYKMNDSTGKFELAKRFDATPIDTVGDDVDGEAVLQSGSPDMCVMEDELVVAYRFVERLGGDEEDTNNVAVWKTSDPDYTEWFQNEFEVEGSFGVNYDRALHVQSAGMNFRGFRLRLAAGPNALCMVYYGKKTTTGLEYKDMRTLVSYNKGASFEINQNRYAQFSRSEDSSEFVESSNFTGLFSYFVPGSEVSDSTSADYRGYNPNFDIYYDKSMGEFVIIKGGDPDTIKDEDGRHNSSHLVAIKTIDGDFMSWEPCLDYRIDQSACGGSTAERFVSGDVSAVVDVAVVPGETRNDLFMLLRVGGKHDGNIAMSRSEFQFVDSRLIDNVWYEGDPVAFGGRYHERFLFSSSAINMDTDGYATIGNGDEWAASDWENDNLMWLHDLTACRHRNQLYFTAKQQTKTRSYLDGYGVAAPVSNLTEVMPYQYNYPAYLLKLQGWGFSEELVGDGSTEWKRLGNDLWANQCVPLSPGDRAYFEMDRFVHDALVELDSDTYKIKFTFSLSDYSGGTGAATIVQIGDYTLQASYSGKLSVHNGSGTEVGVIYTGEDPGAQHEVALIHAQSFRNPIKLMAWWREAGDDSWTAVDTAFTDPDFVINATENASGGLLTYDDIRFGLVDLSGDLAKVNIGNIHIGFGDGHDILFEPVFSEKRKKVEGGDNEGAVRPWSGISGIMGEDPSEFFSDTVTLNDGSVVRFEGDGVPTLNGETFEYGPTRSVNFVGNLTNGMANSVYDFTDTYGGEYKEVVFENVEMELFNCISLINATGVYGFTLVIGDYENGAWSQVDDTVEYTFPFVKLTKSSFDNNTLIVDEEFEEGALKGYSIMVYDPDTSTYESQYLVQESYDSVIVLDRSFWMNPGEEVHLMASAVSFDVPERIVTAAYENIGIRFKGPSSAARRSVGEVVLGRWIDWSDSIVESESEMFSNFGLVESDFGLLMSELAYRGNVATNITLTASKLRPNSDEFFRLFYSVNSMFELERAFPMIIAHTDGIETRYVSVDGGFSNKPDGIMKEIEVPLVDHDWTVGNAPSRGLQPPTIDRLTASSTVVTPGTNVSLSTVASDPLGRDLTYSWDFGDGTQSGSSSSTSTSHTFAGVGSYRVQCRVENTDGLSDVRSMTVEVEESGIVSYDVIYVSGQTIDNKFTVEVDGKDIDGTIATYDSSMPVTVSTGKFDQMSVAGEDLAGIPYNPEWAYQHRLLRGETSFTLMGHAYGDYTVELSDRKGTTVELNVSVTGDYPSATVVQDWSTEIAPTTVSAVKLVESYTGTEAVEHVGISTDSGYIYGLDKATGAIDWNVPVDLDLQWFDLAVVDKDNGTPGFQPASFMYAQAADGTINVVDDSGDAYLASDVTQDIASEAVVWNRNGLPQRDDSLGNEVLYFVDGYEVRKFVPTSSMTDADVNELEEVTVSWPVAAPNNDTINAIDVSRDGMVWIGCASGAVYKINAYGSRTLVKQFASPVTCLSADYNGRNISVGVTGSEVHSLDASGSTNWSATIVDPVDPTAIAVDRSGNTYVGTDFDATYDGQIMRYSRTGALVWGQSDVSGVSIANKRVDELAVDRDGTVFYYENGGYLRAITQS